MIYKDLRIGHVKSRTHTHTHSKNHANSAVLGWQWSACMAKACALILFILAFPLNATTLTVTIAIDDATAVPDGSLRKILSTATAGDVVDFGSITSITLAGAILIDKNITIDGGSGVTIAGSGSDCLFKITAGDVIFKNLTLTGGKTGSGSDGGGAVKVAAANTNASLTAESCTFTSNEDARGGAVLVSSTGTGSSTFTANNCAFTGNKATTAGGAVYVRGTTGTGAFKATNCTFTGNTSAGGGGAVYAYSNTSAGSFTATNCFFNNNTATTTGGAINMDAASTTTTLYHCTVVGNTANGTSGGGMNIVAGTFASHNSIYADNTANGTANGTASQINGATLNNGGNLVDNGTVNTKAILFGASPGAASNGCWIPLASASKQLTVAPVSAVEAVASDIMGTSRTRAAIVDDKVCAGAYDINRVCTLTVSTGTGGTVSETYTDRILPYGSKISLTATPAACYTFTNWSIVTDGGDADATNTTANLANKELTGNTVTITPTFTDNSNTQLTITLAQAEKGGAAQAAPATLTGLTCGSTVTFTATPSGGYKFVRWVDSEGKTISSANPYTMTVSATMTVKPVFSGLPMQIGKITVQTDGEIILRPGGTPAAPAP